MYHFYFIKHTEREIQSVKETAGAAALELTETPKEWPEDQRWGCAKGVPVLGSLGMVVSQDAPEQGVTGG